MTDDSGKQQSANRSDHAATTDRVEVKHPGEPVVSADITVEAGPEQTAKVGLVTSRASADGTHRELVDQVMAHPDVAASDKVHVVTTLGDPETIGRLQEHTDNYEARAAGASTVIDADVSSAPPQEGSR